MADFAQNNLTKEPTYSFSLAENAGAPRRGESRHRH